MAIRHLSMDGLVLSCVLLAIATPAARAAPGWRTQLARAEQPRAVRELPVRARAASGSASAYTPPPAPPAALDLPCAGADLVPTEDDVGAVQSATLCLVNQQRARAGLNALTPDPRLQAAARSHTDDMVRSDYFAHTSPLGRTPLTLVLDTGYVPQGASYKVGENLAYGTMALCTPAQIVQAWMESPEHRANMLDPSYRQTGLAVAAAVPASLSRGQPGATYTQEFGTYTLPWRGPRARVRHGSG